MQAKTVDVRYEEGSDESEAIELITRVLSQLPDDAQMNVLACVAAEVAIGNDSLYVQLETQGYTFILSKAAGKPC